jgi:hypothetical protein
MLAQVPGGPRLDDRLRTSDLLNVVKKLVPHGFLKNNLAAPAAIELKNQSGFLRTGARYDVIACPLQSCGHLIVSISTYPPYYEVECLGFQPRIGLKSFKLVLIFLEKVKTKVQKCYGITIYVLSHS